MKWRKSPEELVNFLSKTMQGTPAEPRKMFGFPCYFINGNMFIGAHQENLILRLSAKDRENILRQYDEITAFEPMPGRAMKEYVVIPESLYLDKDIFPGLWQRAISYVTSLPPKEKKHK